MIVTIEGIDFAGKTTLSNVLQDRYGLLRAPKITSIGTFPADLEKRLRWYETTPYDRIIHAILSADIERRKHIVQENVVVERGKITVISNCIAKTVVKERCAYSFAENVVHTIAKELKYAPREDLIIYLRVLIQEMPLLEKRKLQRESSCFNQYESEYYPVLLTALEAEAAKFGGVECIGAFQSMERVVRAASLKLKWNQ